MSRRILLVDDTKTVLLSEMMMLQGTGVAVETAQSGIEALEKLDVQKPDVILLDIMMPEMNGIEFCRRVRSSDRFSDIPIIIVTTKSDADLREMAFQAGCNDYVTKPVTKAELLSKLNAYFT